MAQQKVGLVGLAVMGENLALNIEEHGFPIAVFNRSTDKVDDFVKRSAGKKIVGTHSTKEFCAALERPRRIIMMVKAGKPVDDTIASLVDHLEPGDILIDGGNEFFANTVRRVDEMKKRGIHYFGMGVSGGEEGARKGPSMMPGGGDRETYDKSLAALVQSISAKAGKDNKEPCVAYMGPGGAGHYVKMVHNGIEYGDMQLIAEVYDILKTIGGLGNDELHRVFDEWNRGELKSFLIEITAQIFTRKDPDGDGFLVDKILDLTGMKGTGKWTVEQGAELAAPIPTIASSLEARVLAAMKKERVAAASILGGPAVQTTSDKAKLIEDVRHALYASKLCSYAQGMNLLRLASAAYQWNLDLGTIASIWRGGCIIRAQFLDRITDAFRKASTEKHELANLLVAPDFAREMSERQAGWRRVVGAAVASGLPVPSMSASLAYFDSYRRARLPANLTQAQRDFFGAHTFQRVDKEGSFHADWSGSGPLIKTA
jgi:6-phosphogluconate dehydrogenase